MPLSYLDMSQDSFAYNGKKPHLNLFNQRKVSLLAYIIKIFSGAFQGSKDFSCGIQGLKQCHQDSVSISWLYFCFLCWLHISHLLLYDKLYQMSCLKTTYTYDLMVFVGQEVGHSWPGSLSSGFLNKDYNKSVRQHWGFIWKLAWGRTCCQPPVVLKELSSWWVIWLRALLSAVRPLEPLHILAHSLAASFIRASEEEFTSKTEIIVLWNIIVEVACYILVVRSKSQVPTRLREKGLGRAWIPGIRGNQGPS